MLWKFARNVFQFQRISENNLVDLNAFLVFKSTRKINNSEARIIFFLISELSI